MTTLKEHCKTFGADCAGVADLEPFKRGWVVLPENLLAPYTRAVSVAKRLDNKIMNSLTNGPIVEYAGHYREVNGVLDGITAGIVAWIEAQGYQAKAVPASFITDETNLLGKPGTRRFTSPLCAEQTLRFKAMPGIGARICGVCVKVCPFGRRKQR